LALTQQPFSTTFFNNLGAEMLRTTSTKTIRHQKLRREFELANKGGKAAQSDFRENFIGSLREEGEGIQERWSVKELFEQFVEDGREAVRFLDPRESGGFHVQESANAVDTSNFANIIGQIAYTGTLLAYESPEFVGDQLVETVQTSFNGEKLPGIGRIGDDVEIVNEAAPYPNATFSEEWVDTPETIKRGLILDVTKEIIYFDRTGLLMQRAGQTGDAIRISKEKRILDCVTGVTTIYRRNGGAAEATYQSDNSVTNTLTDWTSIDTAQQKFNVMTDPNTGEPIALTLKVVLVPKALEITAGRIQTASMVRTATQTAVQQTYNNGNLVKTPYSVVSGQYVRQRTSSDTTWFAGDPKSAFAYMQNWPLQTVQAPDNNEVGFTRDVVVRFKSSERGAPAVKDRRRMLKCT